MKKHSYIVFGIVAIIFLYALSGIFFGDMSTAEAADAVMDGFVSKSAYLTYGLITFMIVAILGFGIMELIKDPKSFIRLGITGGALVALLVITYYSASTSISFLEIPKEATAETLESMKAGVQFVGGLTATTGVLLFTGLAALVGFEVKNSIA